MPVALRRARLPWAVALRLLVTLRCECLPDVKMSLVRNGGLTVHGSVACNAAQQQIALAGGVRPTVDLLISNVSVLKAN